MRRLEIGDGQPGVYLGSLDRGMPEHFLQMPDRRARPQHVRRATVSEAVGRDRATNVCRAYILSHDLPNGCWRQTLTKSVQEQMPIAITPGQSARTPAI
jgi:hypothetical protein